MKRYVDHTNNRSKLSCLIHGPGINQMNVRSWETLVLSEIKVGLLRTTSIISQTERNSTGSKRIMLLLTVKLMKSSCRKIKVNNKEEEHENVESDFDKNELH